MTAVLKIYGNQVSGNCLKGKWVADLLAIPNDWIEVDVFVDHARTREFLALNPAAKVPVAILQNGRVLAQSNAIVLYLAEGSRLVPSDAYDRAKMYEWLFWKQYNHEPTIAVRIALLAYRRKTDQIDPALRTKGNSALARMELHPKETPYFIGEALAFADVALVAYTRFAHRGGIDLAQYPAVKAWVARVERDLNLPVVREAA